jgi:FkbM family methyltransferase
MKQFISKMKQILCVIFNKNAKNCLLAFAVEKYPPTCTISREEKNYIFFISSNIAYGRAMTIFHKELDTIEWIDSFHTDEVFYDIGANVGVYTVYAATRNNMKVYAFEPTFHNYYLLNKNIFLNELRTTSAFNIALSNENKMEMIHMKSIIDGAAEANLGNCLDHNKRVFAPAFSQGVISYRLDDFIEKYDADFPTHIKIDVDGLEAEIVEGSMRTLQDRRLRSVLIEINEKSETYMNVVSLMERLGFKHKKTDLSRYQAGSFINYIFIR